MEPRAADYPLVLVVGADPAVVVGIRDALVPAGYRVAAIVDHLAGMAAVRRDRPAVVLAGGGLKALGGIRALIGVCRLGAGTPVALLGPGLVWVARRAGVPVLPTPVDGARLRAFVAPAAGESPGHERPPPGGPILPSSRWRRAV